MSNILKFTQNKPQSNAWGSGSNRAQNLKFGNKTQVIEQLRSVGNGTLSSIKKDVLQETPKEFLEQMFGLPERRVSGELIPGEALEVKDALSGKDEANRNLRVQLTQERQLRTEQQEISAQKQRDLKMQLSVLTSEVGQLAQTTQGLSREVRLAVLQTPVEPGTYHVVFFEKLVEFIRDFRMKVENSSVWLASYNTKAKKKAHTFWGQVGTGGAKRLLSSEDYSQRAAA